MKKLFFAFSTAAILATTGFVTYAAPTAVKTTIAADDRTKVDVASLPAAVKEAVAKQYAGYEITEAYAVKEEGSSYYELSLKKGDDVAAVKFSAEGQKL